MQKASDLKKISGKQVIGRTLLSYQLSDDFVMNFGMGCVAGGDNMLHLATANHGNGSLITSFYQKDLPGNPIDQKKLSQMQTRVSMAKKYFDIAIWLFEDDSAPLTSLPVNVLIGYINDAAKYFGQYAKDVCLGNEVLEYFDIGKCAKLIAAAKQAFKKRVGIHLNAGTGSKEASIVKSSGADAWYIQYPLSGSNPQSLSALVSQTNSAKAACASAGIPAIPLCAFEYDPTSSHKLGSQIVKACPYLIGYGNG